MDRIKKGMTGNFVNIFNSVDRIGVTTTGILLHDEDIFSYVEKLKNITISDIQNKFNEVFHNENSTKVIIQ
jgi:predicted Zn-dependent peptidase